jgi:predicted Fe-Mo cluster-binding NifX family protein
MKICIPTHDERGMEAALAVHFGRAEYLTLFDSETRAVQIIPNDPAHRAHDGCDPANTIRRSGAEAVICRGLGRRALVRLTDVGLAVFVTGETHVSAAMAAFEEARLERATVETACGGGHGSGCSHGHAS